MTRRRLSEEEVQNVDAVRGDIEQRSTAGFGGIDQPTAAALPVKPGVAGELGKHGFSDRASFEQLFRPLHLGIRAAIVGDAERLTALVCDLNHRTGLGLVHGHRLFAEHMLARSKSLNCLRGVQEDRSADVHSMHCVVGEGFV